MTRIKTWLKWLFGFMKRSVVVVSVVFTLFVVAMGFTTINTTDPAYKGWDGQPLYRMWIADAIYKVQEITRGFKS